ncbi:hypothetical protein H1D24_41295 [Streptomyces sp. PSKA28]|uniref:Uncharacterized protein n=1 Tax=Streptomyces himalayensis subsp. himalayensis TaxID=2756131 RepID=A0A7W0DX24_9ACTN|nr:hypothetical protein [Streptomyces himalayensis subsp. himalayensis]
MRASMAAIRAAHGIRRHGLVLKVLTALKQICNHPAHYLKEPAATVRRTGRSGKLDLLDELDGYRLTATTRPATAPLDHGGGGPARL